MRSNLRGVLGGILVSNMRSKMRGYLHGICIRLVINELWDIVNNFYYLYSI